MSNRPGLAEGRKNIARVKIRERNSMESYSTLTTTSPTDGKNSNVYTHGSSYETISDTSHGDVIKYEVAIGKEIVVCRIRGLRHSPFFC